jgi:hypothetical protein
LLILIDLYWTEYKVLIRDTKREAVVTGSGFKVTYAEKRANTQTLRYARMC